MAVRVDVAYQCAGRFLDLFHAPVLRVDNDDAREIATFHLDVSGLNGRMEAVVHRDEDGNETGTLVPVLRTHDPALEAVMERLLSKPAERGAPARG